MTWIKVVTPPEDPHLQEVLEAQAALYPEEYHPSRRAERRVPETVMNDSIVLSHSLIPEALRHAFGTFGALMNPDLPLSRRQHEMIALTVSALNRCYY
ncbi:MAG: hypothetical protein M3347_02670 [Armatimonadota bacterium]|nr:hypothetical protein [Armatimonadota bacterium]